MPHTLLTLTIAAGVGCAAGACSMDRVATNQKESTDVSSSRRMADGKEWTTNNLSINIDGSFCYEGSDVNCGRYGRLSSGGSSGFNALLGGGRENGQFARLEAHGFYNFGKGGLALNRQRDGSKQMAVSVRCIKG